MTRELGLAEELAVLPGVHQLAIRAAHSDVMRAAVRASGLSQNAICWGSGIDPKALCGS